MKVFSLKKLRKQVYEIRFDDAHEMCMAFLRYQEFYESPRFVGCKFTIAQFMSWYVKSQSKNGTFSYPQDWGGFNLPIDVIARVRALGIDDPNHYDSLMHFIHDTIKAECDDAYLIGLQKSGVLDKHEMTHAMFAVDDNYRQEVLKVINDLARWRLIENLQAELMNNGYAEVTTRDEINAYITTGDHGFFEIFHDDPEYKELSKELMRIHDTYYPAFTADIVMG